MIVSFLFLSTSFAEQLVSPLIQPMGEAQINWTQMRIEARSTAASGTQSWGYKEILASQQVGQLLQENIMLVPVQKNRTVQDLFSENELRQSLTEGLQDWKTFETLYITSTHEVEVGGYIQLQPYLRRSIMHLSSADQLEEKLINHTGLIIDARGIDFRPVVIPTILDHEGETVFSIEKFSRSAARDDLPVRYVSTPADPICAQIVGKKPAFLHADSFKDGTLILSSTLPLPSIEDLTAIASTGKIVIVRDHF